jgi:hypothetical protein
MLPSFAAPVLARDRIDAMNENAIDLEQTKSETLTDEVSDEVNVVNSLLARAAIHRAPRASQACREFRTLYEKGHYPSPDCGNALPVKRLTTELPLG